MKQRLLHLVIWVESKRQVDEIHFDENNVLSTPAYMLAENISQVASGIEKLVDKLVKPPK